VYKLVTDAVAKDNLYRKQVDDLLRPWLIRCSKAKVRS